MEKTIYDKLMNNKNSYLNFINFLAKQNKSGKGLVRMNGIAAKIQNNSKRRANILSPEGFLEILKELKFLEEVKKIPLQTISEKINLEISKVNEPGQVAMEKRRELSNKLSVAEFVQFEQENAVAKIKRNSYSKSR
jgi:hypothetical protein